MLQLCVQSRLALEVPYALESLCCVLPLQIIALYRTPSVWGLTLCCCSCPDHVPERMLLCGLHANHHMGMTGSCFQEEVWSMAGQAAGSAGEGRSNGEAAQLAPSLSEVHLVEAFFDVEQRLGIAAATAAHPAALPQVHIPTHICKTLFGDGNCHYI